MIDANTLCGYAVAIGADAVRAAQHCIAGESEPTPQEAEAILQLTMMSAAVLEAHAIHALGHRPDLARNVRAFIERMTSDVQKILSAKSTLLNPTPTEPAPPEKE